MKAVVEHKTASLHEVSTSKCINCEAEVQAAYCSACGQRTGITEITWTSMFRELSARWLGFDNQFARTFVGLCVSPGKVVRRYLQGNRVAYLGPLGYYIIVTAIVFLILSIFNISMEELMKANGELFSAENSFKPNQKEFIEKFLHYLSAAVRFLGIALVPFLALASFWLYRKKGYSFLEHTIIQIFASAQIFWLVPLQGLLVKLFGIQFHVLVVVLQFIYYGFFFMDVFEVEKSTGKLMKGVLVHLLGTVIYITAFMVLLLLGVMLYGYL